MSGDLTNSGVKDRIGILERRLEEYDRNMRDFYKGDWTKVDVIVAQVSSLATHMAEDQAEHKALEARILKCETHIVALRAEILNSVLTMEKKFFKWVAVAAAISGGTGASALKLISMFT